MSNLEIKARKFTEDIDKLKSDIMSSIGVEEIIKMNSADFTTMKQALRLLETSEELLIEQCKTIDEMNRKLDLIVKKFE